MRGQAFVSFPNKEIADKARREVAGFPLYGKPMVSWLSESFPERFLTVFLVLQQLSFAKTKSDVIVRREEGEEGLESHKKRRLEHKSQYRRFAKFLTGQVSLTVVSTEETRKNNPLRQKMQAKLKAAAAGE